MSAPNHSSLGGHLWLTALDTLDSQLKGSLTGIVNNHKGDIVTAVLKEAEKKKKLCLQKRWKVQFRGKTVILRDLFDKIIAWVNQFAAVVDVAVQYDPGNASLPWAGIRFLLHVAVSDRHCFESTVHGLESASLLIARYAAFEALYLQKGSSIQTELQHGLTSLYAQILTFLARGIQYFSQPTAIRLVKSVFQTSQNEEIDEIAKTDHEVIKLAQIVDSQVQQQIYVQVDEIRDIIETLQRPVCRLVDVSETHAKALEEERFHNIMKWLSSVPYTQHHRRHSEDRLPSSAQWLFHHPQYEDWKGSSSSSVFLLYGIPGSGKTNLASAVVDAFLSEHSSNPLSPPITYFYCGDSHFGRSWADPDEVMRSLTRQFATVDREKLKIHEQVALEYARREAEAKLDGFEIPRLQSTHCANLILSIIGANPAVIIVDGIDEVEKHRRHELLDALVRVRDESASVVKIFLSSRDDSNVLATLADASTLRVGESETRQDMELFVEHCVSTAISTRNLLNGSVPDDLRKEIKKYLLNRAGEMFLWVNLQVKRLCKLVSTRSVTEALNDPLTSTTTIDYLYSNILENLMQADSLAYATAARAFSWLLCHEKISKLLLNGYLRSPGSGPEANRNNIDWLLEAAAQAGFTDALEELTKGSPTTSLPKPNSSKIVNAAIRKGRIDFMKKYMEKETLPSDVVATAALFGQTQIIHLCLERGYSVEKEGPFGTPLRSASLMGHESTVRALLSRGASVNVVTPLGDALQVAAMKGHLSITNVLLQNHASVDNRGGFFGNALQAAAYRGHRNVVEALLNAGASIGMKGRYKDAFHAAAEAGQEGIIELFLDKGYFFPQRCSSHASCRTRITTRDLLGQASPRFSKSSHDYFEEYERHRVDSTPPEAIVVDFEDVLNHTEDAPLSSRSMPQAVYRVRRSRGLAYGQHLEDECYALEVAASIGHRKIVQMMVAARNKLKIHDFHLGKALWAACTNGHIEVAKAIIAVRVDLRCFIMGSLERAARRGHAEIVDILIRYEEKWGPLSKGRFKVAHVSWPHPDPEENTFSEERLFDDSFESPYTLPLVLAGCRGSQLSSVLRGFQLASQSELERLRELALKEAVQFDKPHIVGFLLENDVSFPSEFLAETMRTAAQHGSKSALTLLLSRDYIKDVLDGVYVPCFKEAVLNGHTEIFEYLMSRDPGVCPPDLFEKAFVHAAHNGYFSIMTSLAQKIQDYESYPMTLSQALNGACAAGTMDIAQWLINAGAEIDKLVDCLPKLVSEVDNENLASPYGNRLRHRNRLRSHENGPRTALEACLQPFLEPDERRLYVKGENEAERLRQESVVKLLLEHGADANQTIGGKTKPLHVAALNFSEEIVRVLIAKGANVNADIPNEGTPLQSAAKREVNPLSIVRLLLESGAVVVVAQDDKQQQNSVLNEALSFFGPPHSRPRNQYFLLGAYDKWLERGRFFASESMQDVLSTGPGAVIKLLLLSQPKLHAADKRFSLLLQMLAAVGNIEFIRLLIDRGADVNLCGHYYGCALQAAARFGRIECVQLLLKVGAQMNLVEGTYGTPLQAAIAGRHQQIVTELIAHGADVNLCLKSSSDREENASTPPLQLAIQSRQLLLTMQLLNAGAKLSDGMPALYLAIEATDFDAAERLIAAGADMNAGDWERSPALITACKNGDKRMIEFLLAKGADVNVNGTKRYRSYLSVEADEASALHAACSQGYYKTVQLLLNHGAHLEKIVKDGMTPLGLAASKGDLKLMELLLESGARIYDPSANLNVFRQAIESPEPYDTIEFLVKRLSNPAALAATCEQALPDALRRGDEKVLLVLLDQVPKTPRLLGQACRLGSQDAVRYVLSHGVGVDSDLGNGERALHISVYHQRVDLVSFLVQEGADVQYVSPKYGTPISAALEGLLALTHVGELPSGIFPEKEDKESFMWRSFYAQLQAASLYPAKHSACEKMIHNLLHSGAEASPAATAIGAPLHVASYMGELSTVKLLLEHGSDINAAGGYFGSALIAAMLSDQEEAFSLLLERGIDVNIRSEKLGTALHYACRHKDPRTVQILLKHGADPNADGSELESPIGALLSRDFPTNHLKFLLERANDVKISTEIFKSVQSSEALQLLLQHQPRCTITPDIFEALADVEYYGPRLVKTLLDQEPQALPTSSVVISVLRNSRSFRSSSKEVADLLLQLLDRNPNIQVSESMLVACEDLEHFQVLLSRAPGFPIRNELLQGVVSQRHMGARLLKVILAHDKSLIIDQESLNACLEDGTPDCLQLILENNPELTLPLELILERIKSLGKFKTGTAFEMLEVLVRFGKKQEFTPEIHRAVQEQFERQSESDLKQLFLRLEHKD